MVSNFRLVMRSGPTVGKVYPLDKNEIFLEVYIKEKNGLDIKVLTFFVDNKNSIKYF